MEKVSTSNFESLPVFLNKKFLKNIEVFLHPSGVYVPLKTTLSYLNQEYEINEDQTELIIFSKKTKNPIDLENPDIALQVLDTFYIHIDSIPDASLKSSSKTPEIILTQTESEPDITPEHSSKSAPDPKSQLKEAPEEILIKTPLPSQIASEDVASFSEDDLLIYEVKIGDYLSENPIDVYSPETDGEDLYYISILQFCEVLDFNCEQQDQKVFGTFGAKSEKFEIHFKNQKVKVSDKDVFSLRASEFLKNDQDYLVAQKILEKIFPIEFDFNKSQSQLKMTPKFLLPFQIKLEREKKRLKKQALKKMYPKIAANYKWFSRPTLYLSSSKSSQNNKSILSSDLSTQIQTSSDFLNLGLKTFFDFRNLELLDFKFKAQRFLNFNPTQKHFLEFGEVVSPSSGFLSISKSGFGAQVTNHYGQLDSFFENIQIKGSGTALWEVELFRDDSFIALTQVGPSGEYLFKDIPVYYGENKFSIVHYGPHGEIFTEVKTYNISNDILKKNELQYKLHYLKETQTSTLENFKNFDDFNQIGASLKYGLPLRSSLSYDWDLLDSGGNKKNYHSLGLNKNLPHSLLKYSGTLFAHQGKWRWSQGVNFNTGYRGHRLNLNYKDFNGIKRSLTPTLTTALTLTELQADYYGSIVLFGRNFNQGLNLGLVQDESGSFYYNSLHRLSTYISSLHMTQEMKGRHGGGTEQVSHKLSFRRRLFRGSTKLDLFSELRPTLQMNSLSLSHKLRINSKLSMGGLFDYQVPSSLFAASLSSDFIGQYFSLSAQVGFNSLNQWNGSIRLSTSLVPVSKNYRFFAENKTQDAAIHAFGFIDKNENQIWNKDEEKIPGISFYQENIKFRPKDGQVFLNSIPENQEVILKIDENSIEDPMIYAKLKGFSYFGRSGVYEELGFPLVETSEIEGTVWKGPKARLPGMKIFLMQGSTTISETQTDFEGGFLFTKVPKGTYQILFDQSELEEVRANPKEKLSIKVLKANEIYLKDIKLNPKKENVEALSEPD